MNRRLCIVLLLMVFALFSCDNTVTDSPLDNTFNTPQDTDLDVDTKETETDLITVTESGVYMAKYHSGEFRTGYEWVDYEDDLLGEYYRQWYSSKNYNKDVTIELEVTAELQQTILHKGELLYVDMKCTNVGSEFMYLDPFFGYFSSKLVNEQCVNDDGLFFTLYPDGYGGDVVAPDVMPKEVLVETGVSYVGSDTYTITEDIPLGIYDLYITFEGYTAVVRNAIEIVN